MRRKAGFTVFLGGVIATLIAIQPASRGRSTLAQAQTPVAPAPQVNYEEWFDQTIKDGYFDFNQSNIRRDAQGTLASDADALRQHPNIKFAIQGNCDDRGSEVYNKRLGERRARTAEAFLQARGIPPERMTVVSFGKDHPVCAVQDDACWQKNRRVHLAFGSATGG
ncbi:MAG: OmpA family protein [Candidatus Acidiferrales bacterium]